VTNYTTPAEAAGDCRTVLVPCQAGGPTEPVSAKFPQCASQFLDLWADALVRMYPARPRVVVHDSKPSDKWEAIGRSVGVHRSDFYSDWAFCHYLSIRLVCVLQDVQKQTDIFYRDMCDRGDCDRKDSQVLMPFRPPELRRR
jgi:hypothetical protein